VTNVRKQLVMSSTQGNGSGEAVTLPLAAYISIRDKKKKAKVQGSNGVGLSSADFKEGACPPQ